MHTFVIIITLGAIFANGLTDAPNAIATCIGARCIKPRAAIIMAAIANLLGVVVMTSIFPAVAETVTKTVNLGSEPSSAVAALAACRYCG